MEGDWGRVGRGGLVCVVFCLGRVYGRHGVLPCHHRACRKKCPTGWCRGRRPHSQWVHRDVVFPLEREEVKGRVEDGSRVVIFVFFSSSFSGSPLFSQPPFFSVSREGATVFSLEETGIPFGGRGIGDTNPSVIFFEGSSFFWFSSRFGSKESMEGSGRAVEAREFKDCDAKEGSGDSGTGCSFDIMTLRMPREKLPWTRHAAFFPK